MSVGVSAISNESKAAKPESTTTLDPIYRLPFGSNPYTPSEARAEFTGFLKQSDVPSAQWCGHCHAAIYNEWRQSAHANSFRTPWYTKNIDLLIEQRGIEKTRHCEGCHNPTALFSGMLTTGAAARDSALRPFDQEGVTCMSCHSIRSLSPMRGLGSYVMGIPTAMLDENGNPMTKLPTDAEIYAHPDRHRSAVMRDLYTAPEFCGSCHKANLPRTLNDYKWLRAFTTYDEWQQSGWAKTSPVPFFSKDKVSTCQTCHMPSVKAQDPAANYGEVHSHRWLGANTAIPVEYGYPEQLEKVEAFLKAAVRVDVFGLQVEHDGKTTPVAAPLDNTTGAAKPIPALHTGDLATVDVVVQNTGIGHSLVPEQRDMYESWLAVEVRDDRGQLVYESGGLDAKQHLSGDTHSFTNRILGLDNSQDGGRLNHHEVWKVEARSYDSTVMPGRAVVERYRFKVPENTGSLKVTASVKYRRFRREFLEWVFADRLEHLDSFPTVTMASDTATLKTDGYPAPPPVTTTPPKPGLVIRWTAYGIGLMDRQQNLKAEAAFAQATAIDPKQTSGYINQAVALYMDGNWEASLTKLRQALAIDPDNARARYYQAMCLRWQFHWKQAEQGLAQLAREYPNFRQLHDDLGYIYIVQREYPNARREFEASLAIDPDGIVAHRWLSSTYAALGMKQQAADEAAATAEIKDDPQAMWRVQSYWRNHLDLANDVVLDHVHGTQDKDQSKAVQKILNTLNPPSYIWIQQ